MKKKYGLPSKSLVVQGEVVKVDYSSQVAWICFPVLAQTVKVDFAYFLKSFISNISPPVQNILTIRMLIDAKGKNPCAVIVFAFYI